MSDWVTEAAGNSPATCLKYSSSSQTSSHPLSLTNPAGSQGAGARPCCSTLEPVTTAAQERVDRQSSTLTDSLDVLISSISMFPHCGLKGHGGESNLQPVVQWG